MNLIRLINKSVLLFLFFFLFTVVSADSEEYLKEHYTKKSYRIEMRDGVKLFTVVYSPKDTTVSYPILFMRTPYTVGPYEEGKFRGDVASKYIIEDKFIIVMQDVRGKFLSEGEYEDVRPVKKIKKTTTETDETTDTYDTIDWLIKNIPHNNGKVGMWGISYPGFYAAVGLIDSHPALKAVSPQAPIADWFMGDDVYHYGALSLMPIFNFFKGFGIKRDSLTTEWKESIDYVSPDMYTFFGNLGSVGNINKKYFKNEIEFWNLIEKHNTYDSFWQERNLLPHLNKISPAVLVTGGWYDGEDLYGPLNIYKTIEKNNPVNECTIVIGPWVHGGWEWSNGDDSGDFNMGNNINEYYQKEIEFEFFRYYLKGIGDKPDYEAIMYDTGLKKWKKYSDWEPVNTETKYLFLSKNEKLVNDKALLEEEISEYIANPKKPVPYTADFHDSKLGYNRDYMFEDQRFAYTRPDVVSFATDTLTEDVTVCGPIFADLFVSTSGTDGDWVVKVIDVYPDYFENEGVIKNGVEFGGYQRLIRYEIIRGKFRNNLSKHEAFIPGKVTEVSLKLQDIFHTFKRGHKIMVQIQNSMFPLYDSNPNKFMNIFEAEESDFTTVTNRVYFNNEYSSEISFQIVK